MTRGSPGANIVGGILLLLLDGFRILYGRLPLKGKFSDAIDLAENPGPFWAHAGCLGAAGAAAIPWGVWGVRSQR